VKGKKKQKPRGRKHKIRKERRREQRIGLVLAVAILIAIVSASGFFIHLMLSSSPQETSSTEPKAAIVDHLSLTVPNQTFTQTATNILEQAGFKVDYYPGEKVTVEFYRDLPTHRYKLIILRVHSLATNPGKMEGTIALFTSERYDRMKYVYEQLSDQLAAVAFSTEEREKGIIYFGIGSLFVKQSMKERFQNSVIIMMGCEGLNNPSMARAFVERGAKVYISWNWTVSSSHTDQATIHMLKHLFIRKQTIKQAVDNTMKEVGPDTTHTYKSVLLFFPEEAKDYTFQNILGNMTTKNREVIITQNVPKTENTTKLIEKRHNFPAKLNHL
jgi:hypothetical protein